MLRLTKQRSLLTCHSYRGGARSNTVADCVCSLEASAAQKGPARTQGACLIASAAQPCSDLTELCSAMEPPANKAFLQLVQQPATSMHRLKPATGAMGLSTDTVSRIDSTLLFRVHFMVHTNDNTCYILVWTRTSHPPDKPPVMPMMISRTSTIF
jgi:hypothetical protein